MITTIKNTYINALLADAVYVENLTVNLTSTLLNDRLSSRMTPVLAKYISENFKVISVYNADDNGFNTVVWQNLSGSDFAFSY